MTTMDATPNLSVNVQVVDGMVPKHEFDRAIDAAQQALRAKTASSQQMLSQASSAMRNALTALSLSEQEVANLKQTVKELQERPAEGTNEIIEREREELRRAQERVADLSGAFRQLQSEVARVRYEKEGFDMPVAMSLPVRIAPELASRVTVIAQLVMLGYSYEDGEMALDAVVVNDLHLALEWLEGRHAAKTQFSLTQRRKEVLEGESMKYITSRTDEEVREEIRMRSLQQPERKQQTTATRAPRRAGESVEEVREIGRVRTARTGRSSVYAKRGQLDMYDTRKRACSMMICMAINPPGSVNGLTKQASEQIAQRCIEGLARLAHSRSAFMILSLGGQRCAFDCLKLYEGNPKMVSACFKLIRALTSNPMTMIHVKKQQRFRLLPTAISKAAGLHQDRVDIIGEGAHTLWSANTLGGKDVQDRVRNAGFLPYVKKMLSMSDLDDPKGKHRRKMMGLIFSLAMGNQAAQKFLVVEGYRALLRKTLQENPHLAFDGEFSSLHAWLKEEFSNPSELPKLEMLKHTVPVGRALSMQYGKDEKASATQKRAAAMRERMKRRGATPEQMYFAKKRVISMLCKIALNPPGSVAGVSKDESEEIAYRSLLALARIAERGSAYLVLTCGGPRTAVDCLRYYLHNADMMYAAMRVLRALLTDQSTMSRLKKQVRFRILPSAILDAVARHPDDLEMKAEAVLALWSYTGIGGKPAQETVMDCGPVLDHIKSGLAQARADTGSNQYLPTIRKFLGCALSLAKDNKDIQDKLVEVGLRSAIRKTLSENPGISFHGEFGMLRDWIRGDRGGAKSVTRSTTRSERNAAERALDAGTQDDTKSSVPHINALNMFNDAADGDDEYVGFGSSKQQTPAARRAGAGGSNAIVGGSKAVAGGSNAVAGGSNAAQRFGSNAAQTNDGFDTPAKAADTSSKQYQSYKNAVIDAKAARDSPPNEVARLKDGGKEWTVNEAIRVLNARETRAHAAASEALAEMFATEPTLGVAIVLNGGIAALAHAITRGNAAFGAGACALLHMLTTSTLSYKRIQATDAVIDGTLFTAIIGVMTRFPRNAALQQWAATAVWAIVKENGRGKTAFMKATTTDEVAGTVTSMRVLKNVLTQFGGESEATAQAVIGCVLSLAINSVSSQKIIADMAFPNLIMSVLGKHPTISFRGEFDNLREWLRDNSAYTEELHMRTHSHAD